MPPTRSTTPASQLTELLPRRNLRLSSADAISRGHAGLYFPLPSGGCGSGSGSGGSGSGSGGSDSGVDDSSMPLRLDDGLIYIRIARTPYGGRQLVAERAISPRTLVAVFKVLEVVSSHELAVRRAASSAQPLYAVAFPGNQRFALLESASVDALGNLCDAPSSGERPNCTLRVSHRAGGRVAVSLHSTTWILPGQSLLARYGDAAHMRTCYAVLAGAAQAAAAEAARRRNVRALECPHCNMLIAARPLRRFPFHMNLCRARRAGAVAAAAEPKR